MDALAVSLCAIADSEGIEILYDKDALIEGISDYFAIEKSQKRAFELCLDSRYFAHAYYKTNINEILFLHSKTVSDLVEKGISPQDAKCVADGFTQLAEKLTEKNILGEYDDKNKKTYELLSAAVKSYDRGNFKPALMVFNSLVSSENSEANYYLGKCWYEGRALAQDYTKAAKFFVNSFKSGSSYGTYSYASCLLKGHGVKKNPELGTELLIKAANMGQEDAAFAAGYMYKDNPGGIKKAIEYLQKSADYGNWSAAISLIDLYYEDAKTTGNFHKTTEAKERLTRVSDAETCFKIAQIYERGIGVAPNLEKALNYSTKAAAKGHKAASEMMVRVGNQTLGRG